MTIQATLNTEIETNLPSNTAGAITATILRTTLHDINNSVPYPDLGNTWTATQIMPNLAIPVAIGPLPFVEADNFTGGYGNILSVRGTFAAPITDSKATAVFQSVNNTSTGEGVTLYASLLKKNTANIDHHCIYSEAVDAFGGGSVSGGRLTSALLGGTGGNSSGSTNVGLANVPYLIVAGAEDQCWVVGTAQEATTTFSPSTFACGVLSTCGGTKSGDAGFLVNPEGYAAGHGYITGFFVPSSGASAGQDCVIDTAFRSDVKCVYGMDLSRGAYSGAPIVAPLTTPASSSATGKAGSVCWDTGFLYVCTATNTWKRAALSTF